MGMASSVFCRILAACFLTLLFHTISFAQQAPVDQVSQVVAAVLDAYGGKEAVAAVTSIVARGTISDFFKKAQGPYARYYARPQKLRIEIHADREGEVRILNSRQGWRGSPARLVPVGGAPLQAMLYQYTYLDLPMGFVSDAYSVTCEGKKEFRGRMLELLVLEQKDGPKVRIYIDPATHLIVRAAAEFSMGMGSSELSTEYEDFRPVGKVLFPFRLVNYAGDKKLSVIALSDIRLNPEIAEGTFTGTTP